ncbi:MAG: FtsX-like permease family protein, partial [Pseudomonadota bacterium]|nr:FtsX-like permease family protein [Pseudomonadota bacterium]
SDGRILTLIGIDPFAARKLNPLIDNTFTPENLLRFISEPGLVLVSTAAANLTRADGQLWLDSGGRLGKSRPLHILSSIEIAKNPQKAVVFGDISWVQEMLQGPDKLKKIDLLIEDPQLVAKIEKLLPSHVKIVEVANQTRLYTAMLDSFNLNLTALSLLSLFVGFYLVYNTVLFALLQRRREIGILLTMGFSRSQITGVLLVEISLIAGLGSLLGLGLGYGLASYSLTIINQTISDLYFFLRSTAPQPNLGFYMRGLAVGIGSAWIAAFFPLLEIRHNTILSLLSRRPSEDRTFTNRKRNFRIGLLIIAASLILAYLPSSTPYFGFAAAFGICLGSSLLVPLGVETIISRITAGTLPQIKWRLAIGAVKRSLSRSAPAVAALMVALSMSMAISLMIGSFRKTVDQWFTNSIQGDFYVTDSDRDYDASLLDPNLVKELSRLPGIAAINRYRNLRYQFNGRLVRLTGVDAEVLRDYSNYRFTETLTADPWQQVGKEAVMISETLARKHELHAGSEINLNGFAGFQKFTVAAVFCDYITEHGVILMDYSNLEKLLADHGVNSLALFLDPQSDHHKVALDIQQKLAPYTCELYANHELRERIMEIFDRSFAITLSTRMIAILVAFFGIISALLAIYLENEREYGILRALGLSRGEVFRIALGHSLTLGLLAVIGAALSGPLLAWILVKVINLKSFGWSIDFSFDPALYPVTAAITVIASLLAGLYPAWRIASSQPSFQMRER